MLLKILAGLAVVILVLAVVIALRPASFRVSRSATIAAPPATIFPLVNDFHRWEAWSPWAKMDPHARNTYEGPAAGEGALFRWDGNKEVGAGNMTITESQPSQRILIRLEFLKPFAAVNAAEFTFKPEDAQTVVTWMMSGQNNFIGKAVSLFIDSDKLVGPQFEQGLATLKTLAENKSTP